MSEQVQLDRYDGTGSSLWPVMRRLDQTASRALDPLFRWRTANWEKRNGNGEREMSEADVEARDRYKYALAGLTSEQRGVLYDVCCLGMDAEALAVSRGLYSSTAHLMFRDALGALERHLAGRCRNLGSLPSAAIF